jgi:hypothetical protein
MHKSLKGAIVTPGEVERAYHLLAAINHRHWVRWENWVLHTPGLHVSARADDVWARIDDVTFKLMMLGNAADVVGAVRSVVGEFALNPDTDAVVARKRAQFRSWVQYAITKSDTDIQKWLLKCRMPFFRLTPEDQLSDYTEAREDFRVVATAGGLVLPDELPDVKPYSAWRQKYLRSRHALGLHGAYRVSEQSWSLTCAGCHRSWSGF